MISSLIELLPKLLPTVCKVLRWFTRRKPRPTHCLIVEDCPDDAEILSYRLKALGYECEVARSGEVAEGAVKHAQFDLVFVDMRLPGMPGEAVLRVLSREAPNAGQIVICGERHDVAKLPRGRFFCVIFKPATPEALSDMARHLRRHVRTKPTTK